MVSINQARNTILSIFVAAFAAITPLYSATKQDIKLKTVVIDAGHGGTDPGAVSKDGKIKEKDLTLKLSKMLGKKIKEAFPDVKIVFTRPEDKFVTLGDRAEIANKSQANLFISLHINASESTTPDGFSTHILGESSKKNTDLFEYNMNVCKRENSVILLEDDYSTKYQGFDPRDPESFIFFHLMQNAFYDQSLLFAADVNSAYEKCTSFRHNRGIHQDPFYVLWKTTMPSVLVESGFISNSKDLELLRNDDELDKIAEGVFQAFCTFKARYDGSTEYNKEGESKVEEPAKQVEPAKPAEPIKKEEPKVPTQPVAQSNGVRYGIQVAVSSRVLSANDPFFGGYPMTSHSVGTLYKYILCEQDTEAGVRESFQQVSKKFPDALLVKIEGEKFTFLKK